MANAPEMIAAWPFERRDMPDGSKAWSGGQWGKPGATMPDAKLFVQKAVMDTRIEALLAAERRKALEEAVKVAADYGDHSYAAKMISAAIRALMEKEQGE